MDPACKARGMCFVPLVSMKTTLVALVVAGFCSFASAQSLYLDRSCGPAFGISYAGNGFAFSYGAYGPQVVPYAQPWTGYRCAPVVPMRYACPVPVDLSPWTRPSRAPDNWRPLRAVVADPVFPVRGHYR